MDKWEIIAIFILIFVNSEIEGATFPNLKNIEILRPKTITPAQVIYKWQFLNFTWPSNEVYQKAVDSGRYDPQDLIISGIGIYKDYLYLSIPRRLEDVPATLTRIPVSPVNSETSPNLEPFPHWLGNTVDYCIGLQSVMTFEIDLLGHMWIIDSGMKNSQRNCPSNLRIIDLNDYSRKSILHHDFLPGVVHHDSYLSDIVVDDSDGSYAYIVDQSFSEPGIIVFSRRENKSWKIKYFKSVHDDIFYPVLTSKKIEFYDIVNGIALGPRFINIKGKEDRMVYYPTIPRENLFTVPTSLLKNESFCEINSLIKNQIDLGWELSVSDGMTMDENGVLYYEGIINGITRWDSKTNSAISQELIEVDEHVVEVLKRYAFDSSNNMYIAAIYRNIVTDTRFDFCYRLLKIDVGARSYLHDVSLPPSIDDSQHQDFQNHESMVVSASLGISSSMWILIVAFLSVVL